MVLKFKTEKVFTNITTDVAGNVPKGFTGLVHVFSRHTTSGIRIIEDETLLKADYERFLDKMAPEQGFYAHNIIDGRDVPPEERLNGHSHIRTLFFPTSEMVPVENGKLMLGQWQKIFLVELDPAREREIVINFIRNEK